MKAAFLAAILALSLVACSDPADSPECKEWQNQYEVMVSLRTWADMPTADPDLLSRRPDGCPIP